MIRGNDAVGRLADVKINDRPGRPTDDRVDLALRPPSICDRRRLCGLRRSIPINIISRTARCLGRPPDDRRQVALLLGSANQTWTSHRLETIFSK